MKLNSYLLAPSRIRWLLPLCLLAIPFMASAAGPIGYSITSFAVTNYTGFVLDGETSSGGRQAIRTLTAMSYINTNSTSSTYDYQLRYQLLDANSNAVPILDQQGFPNTI